MYVRCEGAFEPLILAITSICHEINRIDLNVSVIVHMYARSQTRMDFTCMHHILIVLDICESELIDFDLHVKHAFSCCSKSIAQIE